MTEPFWVSSAIAFHLKHTQGGLYKCVCPKGSAPLVVENEAPVSKPSTPPIYETRDDQPNTNENCGELFENCCAGQTCNCPLCECYDSICRNSHVMSVTENVNQSVTWFLDLCWDYANDSRVICLEDEACLDIMKSAGKTKMQDALENSMKNTTTTMRLAQMKEFYGDMWDLCMIKNEVATTLCMFD